MRTDLKMSTASLDRMHGLSSSFDGTQSVICNQSRPDRYRNLFKLCTDPAVIAQGSGVSYCLASAAENGLTIQMHEFSRILKFSEGEKFIEVEAGMKLGDLLLFLAEKNLWFSVLPGHPAVTIGGAIAFDIHGKSQSQSGNFGDHVLRMKVFNPHFGLVECDKESNLDLFEATIGGMGLTGVIVSATLRVSELPGTHLVKKRQSIKDIFSGARLVADLGKKRQSAYSWHNLSLGGDRFGQGFVYSDSYISKPSGGRELREFDYTRLRFPNQRKGIFALLLSAFFRRHLNTAYQLKEYLKPQEQVSTLLKGSFPFYGNEIYHMFFRRRGLYEHQSLVPEARMFEFLHDVKLLIEGSTQKPTLCSLKWFHGEQKYLRFNGRGLCFSIDFAAEKKTFQILGELDKICIKHSAVVAISKDSRLSEETVKSLFLERDLFKKKLIEIDPARRFQSELAKRLKL